MSIDEISHIFTQRKYTITHVQHNYAYVTSKRGVTQSTLEKRFADCDELLVVGFGFDVLANSHYIWFRERERNK